MLQIGVAAAGGVILSSSDRIVRADDDKPAQWVWKPIKPESVQERAYQSAWAKI
jgi:hypothetical protein